jgi:hypothetical protein
LASHLRLADWTSCVDGDAIDRHAAVLGFLAEAVGEQVRGVRELEDEERPTRSRGWRWPGLSVRHVAPSDSSQRPDLHDSLDAGPSDLVVPTMMSKDEARHHRDSVRRCLVGGS